ncbi:uncharacterized protein LY89DRAFT_722811 [Mollisia scopiformis]|uniref:Uncharacterized protein n=1 Tax=Mollisia scopiformis TaxID=149040 RepID=A0A194WUT6_MOLSC|nr:uncharacterized protein LY89DRAFT_722811 [Mollisia scopiformis]KUJ11715.1 hypothetical protein LY89DRAFT_722811 [Mollisia scopiformis]
MFVSLVQSSTLILLIQSHYSQHYFLVPFLHTRSDSLQLQDAIRQTLYFEPIIEVSVPFLGRYFSDDSLAPDSGQGSPGLLRGRGHHDVRMRRQNSVGSDIRVFAGTRLRRELPVVCFKSATGTESVGVGQRYKAGLSDVVSRMHIILCYWWRKTA